MKQFISLCIFDIIWFHYEIPKLLITAIFIIFLKYHVYSTKFVAALIMDIIVVDLLLDENYFINNKLFEFINLHLIYMITFAYLYWFWSVTSRFNEDCAFVNCNYREHQTHFHCMRKDCNYRFCDKTRYFFNSLFYVIKRDGIGNQDRKI